MLCVNEFNFYVGWFRIFSFVALVRGYSVAAMFVRCDQNIALLSVYDSVEL